MNVSKYVRTGRAIACASAMALAVGGLAACGSSDDDSSTTAATAPGSTAPPNDSQTTRAASGGDVQIALDYVGGRASRADAARSAIKIGWTNNEESGAFVFPEATVAAQAAVRFVNEELGGVGGHPLELVTCVIPGTEEAGQKCGQQFANDDDVAVVQTGFVSVGSGSLFGALAGKKPVVGGVAGSPADFTARDAYFLYGSQPSMFGAQATFLQEVERASSVAILYPAAPGADGAAKAFKQGLDAAGIRSKVVAYPPTTTDLVGPLTAAGAQSADVVAPMMDGSGCVRVIKALGQLGLRDKPVQAASLCADQVVARENGGELPVNWSYSFPANPWNEADPDVALFRDKLAQYGGADANPGGISLTAFAGVLTMAKLFNEIGPDRVTPDAVRDQVRAFRGPLYLGPDHVQCGANPQTPSICANEAVVNTYEGDGRWNTYDNRQFTPPAAG